MTTCIITLKVTGNLDLEVDSETMLFLAQTLYDSIDAPFRVDGKTLDGEFSIEEHEIISFSSRED
jgi:hypothetical protein